MQFELSSLQTCEMLKSEVIQLKFSIQPSGYNADDCATLTFSLSFAEVLFYSDTAI